MKFNFNKFSLKKFISVFAAIAILMTSLPMSAFFTTVGAAGNSSIIDFEGKDASAIVEGNDAFSITGQDSEDKYYFYAKNNTADALTLTFDDIELKNGKQYTLDFDVYTLRVSKDESDVLLGLKMYGDSETLFEKQIKNTDICEENWANYHTTFTAKDGVDKLDFSIYTIGKVFIDNLVIIDENGKETAIDTAAACEATEFKDHFSMATLYDIAYEEPDIIDGYLKAEVPVNSNTIHNEGVNIPLNLDKPLDKGRYTVTVDLKFTSVGSCRDAFCASVAGVNNYDIIQQKWLNAVDITLNKYNTYTFQLDLTPDHNLFRLNVYQGCTAYIDNLALIDPAGIEVVRFDFDEPVNFEGSAFEQKGIARTQAASAALYSKLLAASNTVSDATDPAYKMLFDKGEIFRTTNISTSQEVTISFDYYLADGGVTVDDTYVDGYSTALKSGAVSSFSLTVPNSNQTHSFRFTAKSVTAELYIWNVKIAKSDSSEITFENYTNRTTCEFSEITYADIPEMVEKNFVLLVDTTSVADDGNANKSFWFNELGMAGYGTLPNGTYTVKFDVCPITLAKSGTKFHFRTSNGQAEGAWAGFWQPELTVGEWTTTSSTFTVTDQTTSGNHILFVYGGFKGYIDNIVVLDSNGNKVAGTYTDMGGLYVPDKHVDYLTVDYIVVENEPEVELSDDYAIYQDSSSATTNYDTYFHCYDYSTYGDASKNLPAGEYKVTMDVYAQAIGDLVYKPIKDWANADEQKYWKPTADDLNKWVTVTYTGTTTTGANLHTIIYCQGFKGYVDNITVYSGETKLYTLSFTASENGKAGHENNGAGVVGVLPKDIADAKVPEVVAPTTNDILLIDTTKIDNGTPTSFWFNELGMPSYGTLPNGTYKIMFDVYPLTMPTGGNLFHYRTGNGSGASSDAGWWKPEATIEEWATTFNTFTVKDGTTSGNHILYVYGGFKGYVDNIKVLDSMGNEVAGTYTDITGLTVPEKHKDLLKIETITTQDDEEAETNDVLLIDTTTVTDNGTDNRNFWFNELGMASYGDLPNGTYTIQFDVCALKMPESKNLFHFRTSKGSGSSKSGFWKPNLNIGEWATTSSTFTVTDDTTSGNHILYVYGGFKGYVDNLVILDASGNEVAGTRTGITGLTVPANDRVDYSPYLEIVTINSSNEEEETNDELLVDTTTVADDGIANKSFWFNELGMKGYGALANGTYTIQFDVYPLQIPTSKNLFHFRTGSGSGASSDAGFWKPNLAIEQWTTTSSTFTVTDTTTTGNHILFVYGGFKGYIDNIVILDASGKEVAGTRTDITGLKVPDKHKDYLKIETIVISDGSDDSDDNDDVLSSGMNIAILRGRAGKNGASIKLGGAKSPLTLKSNSNYKLSFRYYQANPTNAGVLNLFGIDTGFDNEITYFKKNNTTGWATGTVYFTTGDVTDAAADWFEIILNPNAWVYFDNFKLQEQEIDNNKAVTVIDFEEKDDSIYPDLVADNCTFGQTTEFKGTSNGGKGYFCASNAREYTNDDKNSNQQYQFGGIKLKSNTTYRVSIDYYVAKAINDYAFAIGYSQTNVGSGSGDSWQIWGNNKKVIGWNTESFVFTTGEVVPNAGYIKLVIYDTLDSSNPRVMYFDNITFTELYRIDSLSNNSELGTVSSTRTVEAGSDSKVVANPYAGVTFEGWYEYGDLVSTDEIYRIKDVRDNHKLVAHFSGTPVKSDRIVQGFEDYDLGDILYEYYEIVDDPKNVLEGKQSLHVKPDKIEVNADHSVFFPLVSNVETQLKEDTEYDVYVWIKPTKEAESTTYFQIVEGSGIVDMSDLLTSPGGTGMQRGIKPVKAAADGEENGWYKFLIGTVTKSMATRQGYGIQVCKFNAFRQEGASIDDMYIDMVELVERVPDYANLKFTESFFTEISNSNFEDKITDKDWAPLTDGLSVEKITDKQYDWQGNYNLKFDAAKSNGKEYVRVIPISKAGKNYTFAAWTKLSEGSDISVGLYKNGNYEKFENVVNGEKGTLGLIDDGKWNRVSFTFNSGDNENAYLVIKGTKGILELDMVDLFIATRAYTTDPNSYGVNNTVLQMTNPIAFPDIIKTETTYVENDDTQDDTYIEDDDDEEETETKKPQKDKKKKKKRVVKVVKTGGTSPWVWVGIGAGALVVAAAVTIFVIMFKKRKQAKKEGK